MKKATTLRGSLFITTIPRSTMRGQFARQAMQVRREVLDILVAQWLDLAIHDGVVAAIRTVAALVGGQRVLDVVLVLAGQFWIARIDRRLEVLAVAGEAAVLLGQGLARVDIPACESGQRNGR